MKVIRSLALVASLAVAFCCHAQGVQNMYAAGLSYNSGASGPAAIAGTGLYAHQLTDAGTYAFTAIDAVPNTIRPFTVNTNIGVGVSQKVVTLAGVPIYVPTAAGISFNGTNTGWQWNGGALAAIPIKNSKYFIMPSVRFLKSSVGGSGYQPILGILFGLGQ